MKKRLPILIILFIVSIIVLIFISMRSQTNSFVYYSENNHNHEPLDIKLHEYKDVECGMIVTSIIDSAQAISLDGKTWFFDDIGCLALWYKEFENKEELTLFVYSRDSYEYIDARKAWYISTAATAMGYGFAANKIKKDKMISFDEMILKMYRGENLKNPYIRKKLLEE